MWSSWKEKEELRISRMCQTAPHTANDNPINDIQSSYDCSDDDDK